MVPEQWLGTTEVKDGTFQCQFNCSFKCRLNFYFYDLHISSLIFSYPQSTNQGIEPCYGTFMNGVSMTKVVEQMTIMMMMGVI